MNSRENLPVSFYKFVLVGSAGAGKSSLVSRYTEDKFTTDYKHTMGVEFIGKINKNVKLQIWDTGDDEESRQLFLSGYLKDANALILVFDLNDKEALSEIEEYLKLIASTEIQKKLTTQPIIILVGKN